MLASLAVSWCLRNEILDFSHCFLTNKGWFTMPSFCKQCDICCTTVFPGVWNSGLCYTEGAHVTSSLSKRWVCISNGFLLADRLHTLLGAEDILWGTSWWGESIGNSPWISLEPTCFFFLGCVLFSMLQLFILDMNECMYMLSFVNSSKFLNAGVVLETFS